MIQSPVIFLIFSLVAVICSLMVVFKRNPVSSAFNLVLVFFCMAGIYALMQAHFVAALQILVYTGAIMVLFVFVIMLLNADVPTADLDKTRLTFKMAVGAVSLALISFLIWVFQKNEFAIATGPFTAEAVDQHGGNTRVIAELLFSEYLLPFELTSVLLLAGIVGTVAIAKRNKKKLESANAN